MTNVDIFPDPHSCFTCTRFVCNHSKWSRRWHKMIYRHETGIALKDMNIKVSGLFDVSSGEEEVEYTITGPAMPAEAVVKPPTPRLKKTTTVKKAAKRG